MRKLLIPFVLVILASITSCDVITQVAANAPPTAYIDSVSPTEVISSDPITFVGHGTDTDGTVVAHRWRSNIDGEISVTEKFTKSSLSEGTHTIYYKVQDNYGNWSQEVYLRVTVSPSGNVKPVIRSFTTDPKSIILGKSSTLSWAISGAALVSIEPDIGNVAMAGNRSISPTVSTIYTIKATNQAGTTSADLQLVVETVPFNTIELFSITAEEGYAKRDGFIGPEVFVGDTLPGVGIQGFLSFDISMIPVGAMIESAALDLTKHAMYGNPFISLGLMSVYNHQYGVLGSKDFILGPGSDVLYQFYSEPLMPVESNVLTRTIQAQVDAGKSRFQIRLQFDKMFQYNREADYLEIRKGKAKLIIKYK